jgi:hypothetical protein
MVRLGERRLGSLEDPFDLVEPDLPAAFALPPRCSVSPISVSPLHRRQTSRSGCGLSSWGARASCTPTIDHGSICVSIPFLQGARK